MKQKILILLLFVLQLQFILAVEPFRFALLTDLHITPGAASIEDLENSVKQINNSSDIEFVLVTGDISEAGDRTSLEKAKSILDKLNVTYYIVSGNHETKWSASGCTAFAEVFGDDRFAFEYKGVRFFGFNTGPILRMADGHVPPQDISWLQSELSKGEKTQPVILATHYPLQYGDVDNWYELTDAVRAYNIRVVLGGHYHRNAIFTYDGIPGLLNRSNLRAKAEVGGYSVYAVNQDSIIVYEQVIGGERIRWAAFSMTEKYYDEKGSQDKYPDFTVNNTYANVKREWIHKTGVGIYSSPVVWNKNVYAGNDYGVMTCYNIKNGKTKWSFKSGNRISGTPAVDNGVLVFGSAYRNIYGLDAKTGKQLWKVAASEPVLGAVTIENGIAYIGASDNTFRAIDIKTGTIRWTFDKLKGYVETKPLITSDKVIFGAWDTFLYALDKTTGKELWRWTNGKTSTHYSPAAVWPVAADNKVFVVDPERAMTAIDIETGKTIWRTKESMVRESIGISEDKSRIYAKTMQDSVVCYSAKGNIPVKIWATNVAYGYEHNPSMLMEKENIVYGSTKNGVIFALNAVSGEVIWQYKISNSLINTVIPVGKKGVLFTAASGEVGLLRYK